MGLKSIKNFELQLRQCVKCGVCQAHCPVFAEEREESAVARGKLAMARALLDDNLELDQRFITDMSRCLLCGSCYNKCPNQVPTHHIVMAARRQIADRQGLTSFGKAVAAVLKHPGLLTWGSRGAGALSPLLCRKLPADSGMRLRLPLPFIARERTLPRIAVRSFRERHPEFIAAGEGKPEVAFFTGCMINHAYPRIGEALLNILHFMEIGVWIPSGQGCCGLPALSSGDEATVRELGRRNLDALGRCRPETILTACASCNAGIATHFAELGEEENQLAAGATDALVYLFRQGLVDSLTALPRTEPKLTVTYHDPCHLRTKGITNEPRELLRALPNVNLVEMEGADRCCGLGGTFSVHHYPTSSRMGDRKAAAIATTGATVVATACPGCILQLQDSINRAGLNARAMHVLALVAHALPHHPFAFFGDLRY